MRQASIVLPRPTSSARSQRTGSRRRGPLGDVELVREERDAPAEERAEAGCLPDLGEQEPVEPVPERGRPVGLQRREPLDGIVGGRERPEEHGIHRAPVGEAHAGRRESRSTTTSPSSPSSRAFWPAPSGSGRRALSSAASVRRVSVAGKKTTMRRPSTFSTRPGPRSGLNLWKSLSFSRKAGTRPRS